MAGLLNNWNVKQIIQQSLCEKQRLCLYNSAVGKREITTKASIVRF